MSLVLGFAIIVWLIGLIYWSIEKILIFFGLKKGSEKIYFFYTDILKPLGISHHDYHLHCPEDNTLDTILRVQKQLEKVANERYLDYCYLYIMSDLQKNRELEQVCRNSITK